MTTITTIAKAAHEINRAYCRSIGDNSQPAWEDAPEWQKKSAIAGVEFHLKNEGVTPEMSHESWLKEKEADGWKYGPVKDPEKKEHPCFLPYDQLPKEQQAKDELFKAVVDSFRNQVAVEGQAGSDVMMPVPGERCAFPEDPLISPHNPAIGEIVKAAIDRMSDFDIRQPECRESVISFVRSLTTVPRDEA